MTIIFGSPEAQAMRKPKAAKKKAEIERVDPRENGVYVARKSCGCVCGICTDYRDKDTGKYVAEWIKDGLIVTHATWTEYKDVICKEATFMDCPHRKPQPEVQP